MSLLSEYTLTDPFQWKGIKLLQDERVLKAGTDALLLATWVPTIIHNPKNILDVGTGSGILAVLLANEYQQSSVIAVDLDENAVELARQNARVSNVQERIEVIQTDVLEFAGMSREKFDLIISNPPFYMNHILPRLAHLQSAKHSTFSPATWMSALSRLLIDHGSICLVLPTATAFEWIKEANGYQLFCNNRMDVFSFHGDGQAKRSLLCFSHVLEKPFYERMTMYKEDNNYTDEYVAWLGA